MSERRKNTIFDAGFGKRIRELRKRQGMTAVELCQRSGVSRPTIQAIEEGRLCRMDSIERILVVFGKRLELIIRKEG